MIITIDGPAGVGKSTAAASLAKALGFKFLNTGAMYRCVTLAAIQHAIPFSERKRISDLASSLEFIQKGSKIWLNGEEVTQRIRQPDIDEGVSKIAKIPAVRKTMIQWQREFAQRKNVVTEGRDQGTEAFPEAECKIFLMASAKVRATRRTREMVRKNIPVNFPKVLKEIQLRDFKDKNRKVGALRKAKGAKVLNSSQLDKDQVLQALLEIVQNQLSTLSPSDTKSSASATKKS
ncbi:MAG: Cytidylate kinase [Planctomycetota bacterium]|jgi:cytidylate kinase